MTHKQVKKLKTRVDSLLSENPKQAPREEKVYVPYVPTISRKKEQPVEVKREASIFVPKIPTALPNVVVELGSNAPKRLF